MVVISVRVIQVAAVAVVMEVVRKKHSFRAKFAAIKPQGTIMELPLAKDAK